MLTCEQKVRAGLLTQADCDQAYLALGAIVVLVMIVIGVRFLWKALGSEP